MRFHHTHTHAYNKLGIVFVFLQMLAPTFQQFSVSCEEPRWGAILQIDISIYQMPGWQQVLLIDNIWLWKWLMQNKF